MTDGLVGLFHQSQPSISIILAATVDKVTRCILNSSSPTLAPSDPQTGIYRTVLCTIRYYWNNAPEKDGERKKGRPLIQSHGQRLLQ